MSKEIVIKLPRLHDAQKEVLENSKRFNVICCGRRWGKSTMSKDLIIRTAINRHPVAYFAPTYKMSANYFRDLVNTCKPLIKNKLEQEKRIELITGGVIDVWSLDALDSVRGRFYKRCVIDEAAITPSHYLQEAWENVIRPLLTDLKGDAWFLSTPKGKKHYYKTLADNHLKDPNNWSFAQMPTHTNPYIDVTEIEDARKTMAPIIFDQEYLAMFTDKASDNLFLYGFNREKHIPNIPNEYDKRYPLVLSFDFNVNPMCCIVAQYDQHYRWIRVIGEYRKENSDVYEICDAIKKEYDPRLILVTGDAAGWNRSASNRGHKSMFDIIQQELKLNWSQIKVPRGKPANYVTEKRNLANALLINHPDVTFSNCPWLIQDIENVEADDNGHMVKSKDGSISHLTDAFCDFLYNMAKDAPRYISKIK